MSQQASPLSFALSLPALRKHPIFRVLLAAFLPFIAAAIQWELWQYLPPLTWLFFYPTLFISASIGGLLGGLIATLFSVILGIYFFIPPQLSWTIANSQHSLSIAIFCLMGVLFSVFHARFHRLQAELIRSNALNLERLDTQLKETQQLAGVGSWFWDIGTNTQSWSEETYRIYQLDATLPPPTYQEVEAFFTPESWQTIAQAVEQALSQGVLYECDAEMIRRDGSHCWITARGAAIRNAAGQVVQLHGTVQDITERKQAEMTTQFSEQRFRRLFQESPLALALVKQEGVVVNINTRFEQLFGFTCKEVPTLSEWWLRAYPDPIYRAHVQENWNTAVASATALGMDIESQEYKVSCINGDVRDVIISGIIVGDEFMATFYDVTERNKLDAALAASEKEFRSLAESMPQIVWISDRDGLNSYFNQHWVDYTGLTLEQSYGEGWVMPFHPDDRRYGLDSWSYAVHHKASYSLECRLRRADGEYRWWLVRAVPNLDENNNITKWFGTCTDIHELKEQARLLADSQAIGQIGSWRRDFKTDQAEWSAETYRLYGWPMDNQTPPTLEEYLELIDPDDRPAIQAWFSVCLENKKPKPIEIRTRPVQGNYRWLLCSGDLELDLNNDPNYIIGTVQDITDSKRNKDELEHYRDHLEQLINERTTELLTARNEAERLTAIKSTFLANMSHEIRSPMNAVLGICYLLEQRQLDNESHQLLQKMHKAGDSLLAIINDILDISKIEAGRIEIECEPFKLSDVIEQLASIMSTEAERKKLELIINPPPLAVNRLIGDGLRLQQVLINLLSNAIKFTQQGEVELSIQIEREVDRQIVLRFSVRDTGIGIPPEQQKDIFSAFSQADSTITRRFGGSGLGLCISQQLVKLMGGDILVKSQMGSGSEFIFDLPFEYDSHIDSMDAILCKPVTPSTLYNTIEDIINKCENLEPIDPTIVKQDKRLSKVRVLIVDDSEINREVAQGILESEGAIVSFAEDGQVAVEKLTAQPDCVDMVLMDIQMPRMDGYTATRLIRQNQKCASLPIVALTAGAFDSFKEAAFNAGMNAFVSKPFNVDQLLITLQGFTGNLPITTALTDNRSDHLPTILLELPGIDLQRGVQRWNKVVDYRKYLTKYVNNYKKAGNEIAELLRLNDIDNAALLIHKLKGTTGYVALPSVEQCLYQLDSLLHDGKLTIEATESLQKALDEVCSSLAIWASANPEVEDNVLPLPDEASNPEALQSLLKQFLSALDQDDPDRAEPFLRPLQGRIGDVEFKLISEHLGEFAFRKAEEVTRKLIQQLKFN